MAEMWILLVIFYSLRTAKKTVFTSLKFSLRDNQDNDNINNKIKLFKKQHFICFDTNSNTLNEIEAFAKQLV